MSEHRGFFVLTVIAVLVVASIGMYYVNEPTGWVVGTGQAVGNPTFQLFYGDVTIDGSAAIDGTVVEAEIQESGISDSDVVSGGEYSIILEGGNDGESVVFSVNGEDVETVEYREYDSTELDLVVGDVPSESPSSSPQRSPSGSVTCTEDWECRGWGSCVGDVQIRSCVDKNNCGTIVTKPEIRKNCDSGGVSDSDVDKERPGPTVSPRDDMDIWFYIIVGFIILIVLAVMLYWILKSLKKKTKKEKEIMKKIEKPVVKKEAAGIPMTAPEAEEPVKNVAKAPVKKKIDVPKKPNKEFFMKKSKP